MTVQNSGAAYLPTPNGRKNDQNNKDSNQLSQNKSDAKLLALAPQLAQAAVNFDGTQAVGTLALLANLNFLNVIKTGTGLGTAAFKTAMKDANYIEHINAGAANAATIYAAHIYNKTPLGFNWATQTLAGAPVDASSVKITITHP